MSAKKPIDILAKQIEELKQLVIELGDSREGKGEVPNLFLNTLKKRVRYPD